MNEGWKKSRKRMLCIRKDEVKRRKKGKERKEERKIGGERAMQRVGRRERFKKSE